MAVEKTYVLQDGILREQKDAQTGKRLCIVSFEQLAYAAQILGETEENVEQCLRYRVATYAGQEHFDYLSVMLLDTDHLLEAPTQLCAYFNKEVLVFVTDGCKILDAVIQRLLTSSGHCEDLMHIIYLLLERKTEFDYQLQEDLEEQISGLEEALITSKKNECIEEIIGLRKELMALKRYYEQLMFVCDEMSDNENGFLSKRCVRAMQSLTSRMERLENGIRSLQDYVTQVREAYQAQVDIKQNQIMQVFTVITAVFLPLTLIVGWYGMNLKMPELQWEYSYPVVIVLSVAEVLLFMIFFKKKHWF
ncbi:MAG: CorA family divalent cation transporter [Lachnospiraceae bacterium]